MELNACLLSRTHLPEVLYPMFVVLDVGPFALGITMTREVHLIHAEPLRRHGQAHLMLPRGVAMRSIPFGQQNRKRKK